MTDVGAKGSRGEVSSAYRCSGGSGEVPRWGLRVCVSLAALTTLREGSSLCWGQLLTLVLVLVLLV